MNTIPVYAADSQGAPQVVGEAEPIKDGEDWIFNVKISDTRLIAQLWDDRQVVGLSLDSIPIVHAPSTDTLF